MCALFKKWCITAIVFVDTSYCIWTDVNFCWDFILWYIQSEVLKAVNSYVKNVDFVILVNIRSDIEYGVLLESGIKVFNFC